MRLGVSRHGHEIRRSSRRRHRALPTAAAAILLAALLAPAVQAQASPSARVSGIVFDSIAGAPIAGVTVHFVGASEAIAGRSFSARTDDDGRYTVASLPAGRYIAGFFHAAVDTLGIETPPRTVEVQEGDQQVPLATPSMRTLIATICPPHQRSDSTGALIGHVLASDVELAVLDASVIVEWNELIIDQRGFHTRDVEVAGASKGPGWFAICDLPSDVVLFTRAVYGTDSSGYVEVELPPGGLRHLTMQIGSTMSVPAPMDGTGAPAPRRKAALTGTVLDNLGNPLSGATVVAWGTDVAATTNERGMFTMGDLPGGTRTVEARALGWIPVRATVHLSESRTASAALRFREKAVVLPTVETRGQLVYARKLLEFERRRRSGFGTFLTPAFLESRPHTRLGVLLTEIPGVRVIRGNGGANGAPTTIWMRAMGGTGTTNCVPTLWVDGVKDRSQDFDLIYSDRIAAVEIYPRSFDVPAQFNEGAMSSDSKCGAVIVWLRPFTPNQPARQLPPK